MQYYVVYTYGKCGERGIGAITIKRSTRIETAEDIAILIDEIKQQLNYDDVIIINWKSL